MDATEKEKIPQLMARIGAAAKAAAEAKTKADASAVQNTGYA